MRAPDDSAVDGTAVDDAIGELVELLGAGRNPTWPAHPEDTASFNSIATYASVKFTVEFLGLLEGGLWGHRQENRKALAALKLAIEKLQSALRETPGVALFLLFTTEEGGPTESRIPSAITQEKVPARVRQFTTTLAYLCGRCDEFIKAPPGIRRGANHREQRAANEAWHLMRRHGLTPKSGVWTSVYGRVARLLFQGMTGERDKNLESECKDVLRAHKKGSTRGQNY
jgi:hypothetical protein